VQSLLASHIALLGPMPPRLIKEGQLAEYYFEGTGKGAQTLVGKHEGRICRLRPTETSLEELCRRHGCTDDAFPHFIRSLLALDPQERGSAEEALHHPFLQEEGECPPYRLESSDKSGEAGIRLLEKYKSLENVESPSRERTGLGSFGRSSTSLDGGLLREADDVPGPATPTAFREQCYLDRERLEKKRSRKSGIARWVTGSSGSSDRNAGGEMPNMDSMMISPKTPASGGDVKKGRPAGTTPGGV